MLTTFCLCFVDFVLCTFLNLYTEQFGMVIKMSLPVLPCEKHVHTCAHTVWCTWF